MRDRETPEGKDDWYAKAREAEHAGMWATALAIARRHSRSTREGDRIGAQVLLAQLLACLQRFDDAQAALDETLEVGDAGGFGYLRNTVQGEIHEHRGDHSKAEECFRAACAARPDDAGPLSRVAGSLWSQGKLRDAEETYRQATTKTEGHPDEAWANLGYVLRAQERYQEALAALEHALRMDPTVRGVQRAIADVKRALALTA